MIQPAKVYESKLIDKFLSIYDDPKYKYFFLSGYNFIPSIEDDEWNYIKRVSVYNEEVLGYLSAVVDRTANKISELGVINFTNDNFIFSRDLANFINLLFYQYNFYKIKFSVVIGNPAEKMYDRFIEKYNGSIIGISKKDCRLTDGRLYDVKYYEIFRQ